MEKARTSLLVLVVLSGVALCGAAFGDWTEPSFHAELNSGAEPARTPFLSSDGLTMYFGRNIGALRRMYEAYRDVPSGAFTSEREVTELYNGESLYHPWVTCDGLRMYYAEFEDFTVNTMLRMAQRSSTSDPWSKVADFNEIHVDGWGDHDPSLTADELTLFFRSTRNGGAWEIWTATRASAADPFSSPVAVIELNDGEMSAGPRISPDGLMIYYAAIRDGNPTWDIYKATRTSTADPFGNIKRLSVSTDSYDEWQPYVTPDEDALYFFSTRGAREGIWVSYLGPIAHWKFDEGEGDIAYDSADGHDGTIYEAQWTDGIMGAALDFDGDDDYVDFGDIDELEFGDSNFAISAWFYGTGVYPDFDGVLVSKYNYDDYGRQWYLKQDGSGYVYFYTSPDGSTHELLASQGNAYLNQWVHVVGVRDGSTKRLYLNGVLDNTQSTAGVITGKTSRVYVGGSDHPSGLSRCFSGTIDDVRIYERALSAEEVQELWREAALPIAHWKLDEGEGNIAHDSAGDHDGTIHEAQWTDGIMGAALDFDGYDDYVETAVFDIDKVTVCAWVNVYGNTLGDEQDITNNCEHGGYTLIYDFHGSGKLSFLAHINGGYRMAFADAYTEQDRWYHVAGTYDGDNGYLYVDGVAQTDSFGNDGLITDTGLPLLIGANPETDGSIEPGRCFNGKIDDVRLYDWALSAEEIQEFCLGGLPVVVDIKPGGCPNPVNVKSMGVLPVAVLGAEEFDVNSIDAVSVRLAGVEPLRSSYEDVASPAVDGNECPCSEEGPDGYTDLTLKFETQEVVEALGEVNDGDVLTVRLTGVLQDGTPIEGMDCILVHGRFKPFNRGDINKNGVTDIVDFAMMAETWLESTNLD